MIERVDNGKPESRQRHDDNKEDRQSCRRAVTTPNSSRAISGSDLPFRRIDATRMTKSCTAPASTAPITNQRNPGEIRIGRQTGPSKGPAPAIAAKWWPKRTTLFVGWKFTPSFKRTAGVIRRLLSSMTLEAIHRP